MSGERPHATGPVPIDDIFTLLASTPRRSILFHLRQQRAATIDELVDVVSLVADHTSTDVHRDAITTSLRHVHLPKLADYGLVTHDPAADIVESTDRAAPLGPWLDIAVRAEFQYENATEEVANSSHITILLADDEPGLPESIAAYLERENDDMSVTTATSALDAVDELERSSFDCIVSDYQMPAVSGLDFLTLVRQADPEVPFILFTARGSETVASEAIASGVTDYVRKGPSTDHYDELADRIRRTVSTDAGPTPGSN